MMHAVLFAAIASFVAKPSLATPQQPAVLALDATHASRGIITARETLPASAGTFTVVYPKWIPGEHGPTGPLHDLAALTFSANGKPLRWRRDKVDMYAFHVDVPAGVHAITAGFDVLLDAPGDVMSTHDVAILNWNRALLYQEGVNSHDYYVKPSIILPSGWDFATALRDPVRSGDTVDFAVTPLNMLVDSPLDMGRYVKKWTLWKQGSAFVQLDAFADQPQDLDIPAKLLSAYERVPGEAFALYGSRHFIDYHALLTLSDRIGFQGIEHHQSSDNRAPADFLTNPKESLAAGDLITHEFSHSWNGKYRRPYDLTTPNFQVPQKTDLLWVYEGMNQYLGDLLSFRAGIRRPEQYPEYLATIYASMAYEPGRDTTPLIDLTTGAPYYYEARGQYPSIRRTAGDFYTEGELIWLDADTIIRRLSHGTKSLDTFLHLYSAPALTGPITKTYTRAGIERLLNRVQPYDWHAFFQRHVYEVAPRPPTSELARSGWKFLFTAKPNEFITAFDALRHMDIQWYSIGANLNDKGDVLDVRDGSPAWDAGLAPGMTIVSVDGQQFTPKVLDYALTQAEHSASPISLIVSQTGWYQPLSLNYHGGPRYPHLQRIPGVPDMLAKIMAPHARPPAAARR
jgi:predicted metalloprotease with PDZ domain